MNTPIPSHTCFLWQEYLKSILGTYQSTIPHINHSQIDVYFIKCRKTLLLAESVVSTVRFVGGLGDGFLSFVYVYLGASQLGVPLSSTFVALA